MKISCSECDGEILVDDAFAGAVARCPHCKTLVFVPGEAADIAGRPEVPGEEPKGPVDRPDVPGGELNASQSPSTPSVPSEQTRQITQRSRIMLIVLMILLLGVIVMMVISVIYRGD